MEIVRLTIHGAAKPAGSKRAFALRNRRGGLLMRANGAPVINVVDDCKLGRQWKDVVRGQAIAQWPRGVRRFDGPVSVLMRFVIARPKSHYGTGRNAGVINASSPACHTSKPDVLKLTRAVEDALTGLAWADDAQIVDERITKAWGPSDRLEIEIRRLEG